MKVALLVLGMHRSGTSALSRVLSLSGAALPQHLLGPSGDNETGFWEPVEIVQANDDVLQSAGSRWDDFAEFPASWHVSPAAESYTTRIQDLMRSNYGDASIIVLKDPRICRLMPMWRNILESLAFRPCCVLPIRNPLEVAASLKKRDGFSIGKSTLLWLRHVLDAERESRGLPRSFLTYESLLEDPQRELARIASELDLAWPRSSHQANLEIEEFLSDGRRHHRARVDDLDAHTQVAPWVKRAYEALLEGVRGSDELMRQRLDAIREDFATAERVFGPLLAVGDLKAGRMEALAARAAPLGQRVAELEAEIARRHQAEVERTDRIATLEAHLGEREQTAATLRDRVAELEAEIARRHQVAATFDREVARHERTAAGLRNQIATLEADLADREATIQDERARVEREIARLTGQVTALRSRARHWDALAESFRGHVASLEAQLADRNRFRLWIDAEVARRDRRIEELTSEVHHLRHANQAVTEHLEGIQGSYGWKLLRVVKHVDRALAPPGSRRNRASRLGLRALAILRREGPPGLIRRAALRRERLRAAGSMIEAAPPMPSRTAALPAPAHVMSKPATAEPASIPTSSKLADLYQSWVSRHGPTGTDAERPALPWQPLLSVVMPVYNTPPGLLERSVASVARQTYEHWELCIVDDCSTAPHVRPLLERLREEDSRIRVHFREANGNISASTNDGIQMARGEFVALLDHDDEMTPDALFEMVKALNETPEADVLYSDQDKIDAHGRRFEPFFKPDWSPAYLQGVMYLGHLLVVRRSLLMEVGGCDSRFDGVQDYELALRLAERTDRVRHIPRVLYHWRTAPGSLANSCDAKSGIDELHRQAVQEHLDRLGVPAIAEARGSGHRVRLRPKPRPDGPLVSIMIPTRDRPELIGRCLESLYEKTGYRNYEVIVGDNETVDPEALAILSSYPVNRIELPGAFHFAAFNNRMARAAQGDYLLLLNNDTEFLEDDWLDHLLMYAERPGVGAVGPLLLYPDGSVQHAGVVLGPRGTADHVMRGFPADSDGYAGSLYCTREVSAVTGACLLVSRENYWAVGGLNEWFRRHYEDVDFCLRLRARGLRNLYVASTRLIHHESKTRGSLYNFTDRVLLLDSWERLIKRGDPYYNPSFDPGHCDYTVRVAGSAA